MQRNLTSNVSTCIVLQIIFDLNMFSQSEEEDD